MIGLVYMNQDTPWGWEGAARFLVSRMAGTVIKTTDVCQDLVVRGCGLC